MSLLSLNKKEVDRNTIYAQTDLLGISSKKRQRIRVDGDAFTKQSSMASLLVVFTLEFTLVITGAAGKKYNTKRSHQYN